MDDAHIFRLIGTISRQATTEINQAVKKYDLDNNLFIYLMRIVENEGITQLDLVKLVKIDKTTMSRGMSKLEKNGYIIKKIDEKNKNFKNIYPTDKAKDIYQTLNTLESGYIEKAMSKLSSIDKKQLNDILVKINSANIS